MQTSHIIVKYRRLDNIKGSARIDNNDTNSNSNSNSGDMNAKRAEAARKAHNSELQCKNAPDPRREAIRIISEARELKVRLLKQIKQAIEAHLHTAKLAVANNPEHSSLTNAMSSTKRVDMLNELTKMMRVITDLESQAFALLNAQGGRPTPTLASVCEAHARAQAKWGSLWATARKEIRKATRRAAFEQYEDAVFKVMGLIAKVAAEAKKLGASLAVYVSGSPMGPWRPVEVRHNLAIDTAQPYGEATFNPEPSFSALRDEILEAAVDHPHVGVHIVVLPGQRFSLSPSGLAMMTLPVSDDKRKAGKIRFFDKEAIQRLRGAARDALTLSRRSRDSDNTTDSKVHVQVLVAKSAGEVFGAHV